MTEQPKKKVGGARKGSGRKKGGKNQKTALLAQELAKKGITPLEYMLRIMRSEPPADASADQLAAHETRRFDAATHAAKYVHPALRAVEISGNLTLTHEQQLEQLK